MAINSFNFCLKNSLLQFWMITLSGRAFFVESYYYLSALQYTVPHSPLVCKASTEKYADSAFFCYQLFFLLLLLRCSNFLYFTYLLIYTYFWERERESALEWGKGRERKGERIWSRLYADSREPDVGLELMNSEIMTWAEVGCLTNWATLVPRTF